MTIVPSLRGVMQFLVESKVVFDAFEGIVASDPKFRRLANTGLERGEAIARDLAHVHTTYPKSRMGRFAGQNGMGYAYAGVLRRLARDEPASFLCHYYSFYFAHMSGGRRVGKLIGDQLFDGWVGEFYAWDEDMDRRRESLRAVIDHMASEYGPEEREQAMRHVPLAFAWTRDLLVLIST